MQYYIFDFTINKDLGTRWLTFVIKQDDKRCIPMPLDL